MNFIVEIVDSIKQNSTAYKLPALLCLLGLVLVLGGIFSSNLFNKPKPNQFPKESLVKSDQISGIKIDISGAVKNPGVYKLAKDSRMEEAIALSGGFDGKANKDYISKKLNLSQKLSDGQKIYVPFETEDFQPQLGSGGGVVAGASTSVIGLNTGTQSELEALPGIGPVTAQKIIGARPFNEISELLTKKAVSRSVFEKIKEQVDLH